MYMLTLVYIFTLHTVASPILYIYTRFLDSYLNGIWTVRKRGSVYSICTVISTNKYKHFFLTDEPVADFYVKFIFTPKLCRYPSVFSNTVYFIYCTLHYIIAISLTVYIILWKSLSCKYSHVCIYSPYTQSLPYTV